MTGANCEAKFYDKASREFMRIATAAGEEVLRFWRTAVEPQIKPDGSPSTEADLRAQEIIFKGLDVLFPGMLIVSEEEPFTACSEMPDTFILVDPLDGTREFLSGSPEFTVNLALVSRGVPVAGCVLAPAKALVYLGGSNASMGQIKSGEAHLRPIKARPVPYHKTAVVSRSHRDAQTEHFLKEHHISSTLMVGSSLKFCIVAEGRADVYPRFGPTMEWDTAAGEAVLRAAGGEVLTPDGRRPRYGKHAAGFRNGAFVAWGRFLDRNS